MVARTVIMCVSIGFAVILSVLAIPLFYSDRDDVAIGAMFAIFIWFIAFVFVLIALGAWMAGRNNTGPDDTSLHL